MATMNPSMSQAARDAAERTSDTASHVGQDASAIAKDVTRKASAAVDQAGEMAQERLESMAAYVRRNPLQATAIAAGVGFVFALIARR
jgi:ElaB/YqjD/DUF883 family membrane-anchored ribosome-binding protein